MKVIGKDIGDVLDKLLEEVESRLRVEAERALTGLDPAKQFARS